MRITSEQIIYASWILFGVYWLASAFSAKKTEKREPSAERLGHMILMATGYILLFQRNGNWGILNHRFLPDTLWIAWLGAAITFAGVLFAVWARWNWARIGVRRSPSSKDIKSSAPDPTRTFVIRFTPVC